MKTLMLTLLCCSASAMAADAAHLKLLTEDYPPFNMADSGGRVIGLSTDIVRQLLQRAGISYDVELLPWVRAFNRAVLEPNTCVYSTTRTEQREHQFKWIGPVVADVQNVRKLVAGRIDFWATGKYSGALLAEREKASASIRPVLTFNTTLMYLACNPRMEDRMVSLLNETLERMRRDGSVARISAKYHQD